ncbi:hypothetical protein [Roseibium algae]|uniref:Basal-body rod modification protein FlgD n=1 Tax=Roseibium algae TaxID=3123038 RepID=A0ABU8TM24_9HYPH
MNGSKNGNGSSTPADPGSSLVGSATTPMTASGKGLLETFKSLPVGDQEQLLSALSQILRGQVSGAAVEAGNVTSAPDELGADVPVARSDLTDKEG